MNKDTTPAASASRHTPEPWRVGDAGFTVFGPKDSIPVPLTIATLRNAYNTRRIVSCVNACAGLTDPAAEIAALREALRHLTDTAAACYPFTSVDHAHGLIVKARAALALGKAKS